MSKNEHCDTCANKGKINGLSQETFCEQCVFQNTWRKDNYKRKDVGMTSKEAFEQWAIKELMEGDNDPTTFRVNEFGKYRDWPLQMAYRGYLAGRNDQKQKDAEIASTFRCGTCGMDGKVSDAILNQS